MMDDKKSPTTDPSVTRAASSAVRDHKGQFGATTVQGARAQMDARREELTRRVLGDHPNRFRAEPDGT